MPDNLTEYMQPSKTDSLAKAFLRLGWCGFWALVIMGAIPAIIMVYTFVFTGRPSGGSRSGLPFVQILSTVGFLLSLFIALWFYRYTRIARRIQDPASRPSESSLQRTVRTGLVATILAIFFSMLVLLFEVGTLLYYFLSAPQAGLATVQTTVDGLASWVSAIDMMNLMAVILTLGGDIFALIFGLLLLSRTMRGSPELATSSKAAP
jgi:hypothetical protein